MLWIAITSICRSYKLRTGDRKKNLRIGTTHPNNTKNQESKGREFHLARRLMHGGPAKRQPRRALSFAGFHYSPRASWWSCAAAAAAAPSRSNSPPPPSQLLPSHPSGRAQPQQLESRGKTQAQIQLALHPTWPQLHRPTPRSGLLVSPVGHHTPHATFSTFARSAGMLGVGL